MMWICENYSFFPFLWPSNTFFCIFSVNFPERRTSSYQPLFGGLPDSLLVMNLLSLLFRRMFSPSLFGSFYFVVPLIFSLHFGTIFISAVFSIFFEISHTLRQDMSLWFSDILFNILIFASVLIRLLLKITSFNASVILLLLSLGFSLSSRICHFRFHRLGTWWLYFRDIKWKL